MRDEPEPISIPSKIAVAALGILLITTALVVAFGDRQWHGLETLVTASMLVPLSTALWPLVEVGGNKVLFGIDAARRAIWRRDLRLYEAGLKAGEEKGFVAGEEKGFAAGEEKGFAAGEEKGLAAGEEKGYQRGYDARAAEETRQNGGNGRTVTRRRRRRILRGDQ